VAFDGVPALVAASLEGLGGVVISSLMNLGTLIPGALFNLPNIIGAAFNPAVEAVRTTLGQMGRVAVEASLAVVEAIRTAFSATGPAVEGGMAPAIGSVGSICQQMVSTALSFAGAMQSAGLAIGASFAQGLASSHSLVAGAASSLLGVARAYFPNSPADKGPFSGAGWIDQSGVAVGGAFADGMLSATKTVGDAATTMTQSAVDAINAAQDRVVERTKTLQQSMETAAQGSIKFGSISLGIKTGGMTDQLNELKVQEDTLDVERARLQLDKQRSSDKGIKAAIDARLAELDATRKQISAQKEQIDASSQYGAQQSKIAGAIDSSFNKMTAIPADFAQATMGSFMKDIGISGGGIMGAALDYGMGLANTTVFNVSGIGEALMVKDRLANQQSAGMISR
jgi:hypothetical protein